MSPSIRFYLFLALEAAAFLTPAILGILLLRKPAPYSRKRNVLYSASVGAAGALFVGAYLWYLAFLAERTFASLAVIVITGALFFLWTFVATVLTERFRKVVGRARRRNGPS